MGAVDVDVTVTVTYWRFLVVIVVHCCRGSLSGLKMGIDLFLFHINPFRGQFITMDNYKLD